MSRFGNRNLSLVDDFQSVDFRECKGSSSLSHLETRMVVSLDDAKIKTVQKQMTQLTKAARVAQGSGFSVKILATFLTQEADQGFWQGCKEAVFSQVVGLAPSVVFGFSSASTTEKFTLKCDGQELCFEFHRLHVCVGCFHHAPCARCRGISAD